MAAGLPLWRKTSPLVPKLFNSVVVILISLPVCLMLEIFPLTSLVIIKVIYEYKPYDFPERKKKKKKNFG